jgi:outer membrane protein assembly factor BamB
MRAHAIVLSVALVTLPSCAAHFASRARGAAPAQDPRVTVFRSDRAASWRQFRLGAGLDVVVMNPKLPREFAWRVPTGGISSSPTVMGSIVLVSCNDHHVYAIDAATGATRWSYHAENEVMSQPAYAGNLIYVGIGNSENTVYDTPYFSIAGTGTNKLEAIDARDGIEQWWSGLAGTGMPSQAIIDGDAIAADGAGTVLAVNARTGKYRWNARLPSVFAMSSVVDGGDGRIYLSGRLQNAVYALRASDGSLVWEHVFDRFYGGIGDDPLASDRRTLVGNYLEPLSPGPFGTIVTYRSRARQHVYALEKRTGRLLWDTTLNGVAGAVPRYNEAAIALIYGPRIYVGSAVAPIVTALDMHGRVLWQLHVHGAVKGGISALDGTLYFGDLGGYLWAVDARTGRVVGAIPTDMQFNVGSPIIVNDSVIDGGTQDVIAVPLADIRESRQVDGVTRLSAWELIQRFFAGLIPRGDPHREASYYRH